MVISENVNAWVQEVEKDLNIKIDRAVLKNYLKVSKAIEYGFGYVLYCISPTLFSGKCLYVISIYIKPTERKAKNILKIQRDIKTIAKNENCKYIKQYSHFNNKYNDFLKKHGYKVSEYIKEV